ncbi:MAG: restriction endonuclease subunit S, partial [Cyanobium sp.]
DIGSNIARAVARIPVSEAVNRKWLAACLRSSAIQRYFTNELRTVSQPTLNIKQIEETAINLPPIELQNTFASKLDAVEKICKRSSFSEAQTRHMISALQSRAFSGLLQLQ